MIQLFNQARTDMQLEEIMARRAVTLNMDDSLPIVSENQSLAGIVAWKDIEKNLMDQFAY